MFAHIHCYNCYQRMASLPDTQQPDLQTHYRQAFHLASTIRVTPDPPVPLSRFLLTNQFTELPA